MATVHAARRGRRRRVVSGKAFYRGWSPAAAPRRRLFLAAGCTTQPSVWGEQASPEQEQWRAHARGRRVWTTSAPRPEAAALRVCSSRIPNHRAVAAPHPSCQKTACNLQNHGGHLVLTDRCSAKVVQWARHHGTSCFLVACV